MRFDLRAQLGVAGDAVAHERDILNFLFYTFIDEEDRIAVAVCRLPAE